MRVLIIKGDTQLPRVLAYAVAYAVVNLRHEVAFGDVQHLVKAIGNMEPQTVGVVHVLQSACGADSIPTEPFAVGESELQLVAVLINLLATEERGNLWQLNLTNTGEAIHNLLLLMTQLLLVGKNLPFASTALAIVLADGLAAGRGGGNDALYATLHEGVLLAGYLYIHNIARYAIWHKQHHIVHTGNGFALSSNACNLNVLQ